MADVADYCRQVEAHLTRINGGHLVRVVGPGFALVKQWADEGVPLSVVFRGIEHKAERHAAGASKRPLRIEFCESDVRAIYDDWRRAIGIAGVMADETDSPAPEPDPKANPRRRAASKAIDRAVERLGRLAGRLDLPDDFRDTASAVIDQLLQLRDGLAKTRGAGRDQLLERVPQLEAELLARARAALGPDVLRALTASAERDLAPYRERLDAEAWTRAVSVTVDRGVREYLNLPSFEF